MVRYEYPNAVDRINLIKFGSGKRIDITNTLSKKEEYGEESIDLEKIIPTPGDMVEIMKVGSWGIWSIYRRLLSTGKIEGISASNEEKWMNEENTGFVENEPQHS